MPTASLKGSRTLLEADILEIDLLVGVLDANSTTNDLHVGHGNGRFSSNFDASMPSRASRHVDLDIAQTRALRNTPLQRRDRAICTMGRRINQHIAHERHETGLRLTILVVKPVDDRITIEV